MPLLEEIQTLDDLDLENQIVFLRTDLDSPLNKDGLVSDDLRISSAVPTIQKLQELGARVVVASRFGELKRSISKAGALAAPSIEPAAARLSELCGCDVLLPDSCTGEAFKKVLMELRNTQICVLENLAMEEESEKKAEVFARQLQGEVDIYVADSVKALGLDSASTTQLPRLMEFRAASPNLMKELQAIDRIRSGIDGPRIVIWGGNSLSQNVNLLRRLAESATHVYLVGVAANTMLRALGGSSGLSTIEDRYLAGARTLAEQLGNKLVLPTDMLVADSPKAVSAECSESKTIPSGKMALDLGPVSQSELKTLIESAGTAIWIGTVGFHKSPPFSSGTRSLLEAFAKTSAFTMVAGDDSVAAAYAIGANMIESIDCIAQGGSATLALLDENKLLGLEALRGTHS